MSVSFRNFENGIRLIPQALAGESPSRTGEVRFNSTSSKFEFYDGALKTVVGMSSNTITGDSGSAFILQSSSAQDLQLSAQGSALVRLKTNGSDRFMIDASGNISVASSGAPLANYGLLLSNSATGNTQVGLFSNINFTRVAESTIPAMRAVVGQIQNVTAATYTITEMSSFYSYNEAPAGVTVSDSYGIFLKTAAGSGTFTRRWGVYQEDANATNSLAGVLKVTNSTASSSTSTGATIITGGLGVGGTVYATAFNGPLTGNVTGNASGSAASFTGSLSGDVTGTQGSTAIAASTVTGKLITGFSSGSGTVAATDTILQAINKLDGNVGLKAPIAGPTFTGTVTIPTLSVTGTGAVGTASAPTTKLNVVGSSADYVSAQLAVGELSVASGKALQLGYNTTADKGYIQSIHWGTSQTELMINPNGGNITLGHSSATTAIPGTLGVTGNVGIGTSTLNDKVNVVGTTMFGDGIWPTSVIGRSGSRLLLSESSSDPQLIMMNSSSTVSANIGGSINLGARGTNASSDYSFVRISGNRENATSGNYASYFSVSTLTNTSLLNEWFRISSTGAVTIPGTLSAGQSTVTEDNQQSGNGGSSPLNIVNTNTSNGGTTNVLSLRRASGTAGQGLDMTFQMTNSSSAYKSYARISSAITTNTAGAEDGSLKFSTMRAGTLTEALAIASTGAVTIPGTLSIGGGTSGLGRLSYSGTLSSAIAQNASFSPTIGASNGSGTFIVINATTGASAFVFYFYSGGLTIISQSVSEFAITASPSASQTGLQYVSSTGVLTVKNGFAGSNQYVVNVVGS